MTKKKFKEITNEAKKSKTAGDVAHANYLIETLIQDLFQEQKYREVMKLFNSDLIEEKETFYNFEVAYSLNEAGDVTAAEEVYESILQWEKNNSSVLNNLSNIKKSKGQIKTAFRLIQKAKKLDPKDEIINNNYESLLNIINEQETLKQIYGNAIKALKKENEFVISKLKNFVLNIKKDKYLKNNQIPLPNWKFKVLMCTDAQKADSLKNQWLQKGYIRKTDRRVDGLVAVYEINPFLEAALQKAQYEKINKNWIDGFENVTIENLERYKYFEILLRIRKINKKYRFIIERDFDELVLNYFMKNAKSVVVLSGSLVEALLIYHCEKKKIKRISYNRQNKVIQKDLYDCNLGDLLSYFEQSKTMSDLLVHLGNISRIHRNFIHPGKELRETELLDQSKSDLCFISAVEIIKKVLKISGRSKD